jgi:arylsulfatase A-like enzyme
MNTLWKVVRNKWWVAATVALLSCPVATAQNQPSKPNVLLIVVDDLGYGDLSVHGGKDIRTPHIDALASAGVRCTQGYVCSPYCSPSRAGLLTGRYPTRFGHEFNPHVGDEEKLGMPVSETTIADDLRTGGYTTACIGKWHLGFAAAYHPQARGFDHFFGFLVGAHNYRLRREATPVFRTTQAENLIYRGQQREPTEGFLTDLLTDEAIRFIDRCRERPWFVYLSYNAVHTPLEMPPNIEARLPAHISDNDRRRYLGLLLNLDDAIGRLMTYLQRSGLDRRTLIIFLSDNGGPGLKPYLAYNAARNDPLRGHKGQLLEGGIRVPFLWVWQGVLPAGQTYDRPIIALDIRPTVCHLAQVKCPEGIDGVNLWPYLRGRHLEDPHPALFWRFGPQKAVRQGDWMLVDWRDLARGSNSGWELYHLGRDIGQKQNLALQEAPRVQQMRQAWQRWDQHNIPPRWRGSRIEDPEGYPNPTTGK